MINTFGDRPVGHHDPGYAQSESIEPTGKTIVQENQTNSHLENVYPDSEESLLRLHKAGWTVTCTIIQTAERPIWIVSGYNGENQVLTASPSRDRAWWEACLQARSVAMLGQFPVPKSFS